MTETTIKYTTLKAAGKILGCVPGTVQNYITELGIPCQKVGNMLIFDEAEMPRLATAKAKARHTLPPAVRRRNIESQVKKVLKAKETIGTALEALTRVESLALKLESNLQKELDKLNSVN